MPFGLKRSVTIHAGGRSAAVDADVRRSADDDGDDEEAPSSASVEGAFDAASSFVDDDATAPFLRC